MELFFAAENVANVSDEGKAWFSLATQATYAGALTCRWLVSFVLTKGPDDEDATEFAYVACAYACVASKNQALTVNDFSECLWGVIKHNTFPRFSVLHLCGEGFLYGRLNETKAFFFFCSSKSWIPNYKL